MLAYVHLVRRIGEHRRETFFSRVIVRKKSVFHFCKKFPFPYHWMGGGGLEEEL